MLDERAIAAVGIDDELVTPAVNLASGQPTTRPCPRWVRIWPVRRLAAPSGLGPPGILRPRGKRGGRRMAAGARGDPIAGAGNRAIDGNARSVADLFRAGPGQNHAFGGLPASGRQDPGLHLPSRSSADRLTHALEVAQVATAISRACRLNVALTEAIAFGHDCGHGPGGHASEEALSPICRRDSTMPSGGPTSPRCRSTSAPRPWTGSATTRGRGLRPRHQKARLSPSRTGSPIAPTTLRTPCTRGS